MPNIPFTKHQQDAIRTTGRSVIVSAAAGSGKTAVLAERCAHLVCDLPAGERCDVDELLVLTYTEAAAAEMRSRIVETIRDRALANPQDERLRRQVALVDAAQISTIHAFCLWLTRRGFSELDIEPAAAILAGNEAEVIKRDVLVDMFSDLYGTISEDGAPLGRVDSAPCGDTTLLNKETLAGGFLRLVNDYGLGDDKDIARLVIRLYEFTASLPDPEAWLRQAHEVLTKRPQPLVTQSIGELGAELRLQADHAEHTASLIEIGHSAGEFFAEKIRSFAEQLHTWHDDLAAPRDAISPTADGSQAADPDEEKYQSLITRFERVRQEIAAFEFSRATGPRFAKDADPSAKAAHDFAGKLRTKIKKLFKDRIKERFALFSVEEDVAGLGKIAPYVATLADLVLKFRDDYTARKRSMGVIDFGDQERFAYQLLRGNSDASQPSAIAQDLHRRFAHVIVDEFQDINPLQQAVLKLACHESDPNRPGNLFVVGDVKQSIYRFRLAEPTLFTDRLERFSQAGQGGAAIRLQQNFRSRPAILEAVNLVFDSLMQGERAHVVYDQDAELRPGRLEENAPPHQPVELHVLERTWKNDDEDEPSEAGTCAMDDPARWTPIEREAYLIGSRIRSMLQANNIKASGETLSYRDIAVLVRAKKVNADRIAGMLMAMGIPTYADVTGSLLATREVRDVLAALDVFDNEQQDIPLAAVLRNGILGDRLTPDDLVEIRALDRQAPYHQVVHRYTDEGPNEGLRARLGTLLRRIRHYRSAMRRRPLAEVLWKLYTHEGYLAYAGGLPGGVQRRANLLKFHQLTRTFGTFRKQGLHRFLHFVHSLDEDAQAVAAAPTFGATEDVVRIMSIHQSKGLEFPVIFVAGLGTKLNLGDKSGRMIFERKSGLGLRVVETKRMLEYPSLAHRCVAAEVDQTTRAEELRVLYVAMTRARDKLVLVGSVAKVDNLVNPQSHSKPSRLLLETALSPLDWLIPILLGATPGTVSGLDESRPIDPLFELSVHRTRDMLNWKAKEQREESQRALHRAAARLEPLPTSEPTAPDDPIVEEVFARLDYVYPWLASSSVSAVAAASSYQPWDDTDPITTVRTSEADTETFETSISRYATIQSSPADEAARRGVATHRVLEQLDFKVALDSAGLASELQRIQTEELIDPDDAVLIDLPSLQWFVTTPLAAAIRSAGDQYRREFSFTATEPLTLFDPTTNAPDSDQVLVRGIVDGLLPSADGIEIIDFKTDSIEGSMVQERSKRYRGQMDLYARAMSRLWRRPVIACRLVFLSAQEIVSWKVSNDLSSTNVEGAE